ncbi:MAG: sialidase family protein [Vicinamibacteria bacterium]
MTTTNGVRVSSMEAAFDANCGRNESGTAFVNAEVEPHLAINPSRASNLIAAWQQDRWSTGGARGLVAAASNDAGATWTRRALPFSRCAGGTFERASDPWVTIGPTGIAQFMSLSITGSAFTPGSTSAMLVSRSTDGGFIWSVPQTLIQDTAPFFNDKNSMTADPYDARYVYGAWDRLEQNNGGPAYFVRSTDGGMSWEPARPVYDPGPASQTIGAEIVVTTESDLLYFFTKIDQVGAQTQASVVFIRSRNRGETWSAPVVVARLLPVGARDPDTSTTVRDGATLMHAAAGPGVVVVTWQDARFSNGARDGIAFSQSRDGGLSWSDPVAINGAPAAAAFTPQAQVAADGLISVGYFDLRANTPDARTLPTQYWMTRSADGRTWTETAIAGPFNLAGAPNVGGYFIGDYAGLVAAGASALSLLAISGDDANNRTDIFFSIATLVRASSVPGLAGGYRALEGPKAPSDELARRSSDEIVRSLGRKMTIRPRDPGRPS